MSQDLMLLGEIDIKEALLLDKKSHVFEVKDDGDRQELEFDGEANTNLKISNKRGRDTTAQFPEIARNIKFNGNVKNIRLDGEMCVFIDGKSEFNEGIALRTHLQNKTEIERRAAKMPVTYVVFDILYLNGLWVTNFTWQQRRELLEKCLIENDFVKLSKVYGMNQLEAAWGGVIKRGLEGVVIKKKEGRYQKGMRSNQWLKVKNWVYSRVKFSGYEKNNAGITCFNDKDRVLVAGNEHQKVKNIIEKHGFIEINVRHLICRTKNGALREPTYHGFYDLEKVEVNIDLALKTNAEKQRTLI